MAEASNRPGRVATSAAEAAIGLPTIALGTWPNPTITLGAWLGVAKANNPNQRIAYGVAWRAGTAWRLSWFRTCFGLYLCLCDLRLLLHWVVCGQVDAGGCALGAMGTTTAVVVGSGRSRLGCRSIMTFRDPGMQRGMGRGVPCSWPASPVAWSCKFFQFSRRYSLSRKTRCSVTGLRELMTGVQLRGRLTNSRCG